MLTPKIIPDDALFEDVIQAASKAGMHLISNGKRMVVSPFVPPGWSEIAIKIIGPNHARLELLPCAA